MSARVASIGVIAAARAVLGCGLCSSYVFILIVAVIVSWLVAFDVINIRNNLAKSVLHALSDLTEPVLAPIRRYVPPVGGLDLSFLVLVLVMIPGTS